MTSPSSSSNNTTSTPTSPALQLSFETTSSNGDSTPPTASNSPGSPVFPHTPVSASKHHLRPSLVNLKPPLQVHSHDGISHSRKDLRIPMPPTLLLPQIERTGATVLSGADGISQPGYGAEESWSTFVDSYSRSQWVEPSNGRDGPPLLSTRTQSAPNVDGFDFNHNTPNSHHSSREGLNSKLSPPVQNISLPNTGPPPPGPYEDERRRVVKRFGLDGQGRREAIDRCADLAQAHFHTPTVIISLVLDNKQVLAAEIGWEGERDEQGNAVHPLRELPLDQEVMKRLEDDCFVIEDARADWRFNQNPYARDGGKLSFFASAPIHLPTAFPELPPSLEAALAGPKPPPTLPVGSICIIDREPRKKEGFSEEDRMVLKSIADMIAREFQLGFEQQRRETEARQTLFLGEFLRTALVNPSRADKPLASDPHLKPHPLEPTSRSSTSSEAVITAKKLIFQEAASNLTHLTQADTAVILDLRAFSAPFPPARLLEVASINSTTGSGATGDSSDASSTTGASGSEIGEEAGDGYSGEASRWGATFSGVAAGTGNISVMGAEGDFDWQNSVVSPGCAAAVSHFLIAFYSDHISEFDSGTVTSPLSDLLPANTEASISVIFDHDSRPCLLLILCSFVKYFRFEPTDRQFVENVGAVAVGSLMRRRILEADRAKLAFVSQISHELRTPLHGIGSQIELIREVSAPAALIKLKPLLDTADVCISSLREVLDDTLEFAKISNSTEADSEAAGRERQLVEVDLERLVEDVAKSCWTRTRQNAAVAGDSDGNVSLGTTGAGGKVDVVIEMDQRLDGWRAMVDVGAIKRVLLNILGNALKFTTVGSIVITVYEVLLPPLLRQIGVHMIAFAVQDSGIGMSAEFIREALFIPFKQSDPFSNGAGLGVSICDSIVRRMHGTLHFESIIGEGTTARILLPLKLVHPSRTHPSGIPPPIFPLHPIGPPRVRIISDELNSRLDPIHIMNDAVLAANLIADEEAEAAQTRELQATVQVAPAAQPLLRTPSHAFIPLMENGIGIRVAVLVVEDNAISRRILTTFLSAKGIPHAEAHNGVDAIEKYKSFRPNLVWCDIQMPTMDGIQATSAIRAFELENSLAPAHIVALTGLSSESKLHKASLSSGQFDEWLVKGGPSLKILTAGLVRRQAVLDQLAARKQIANTLTAGAQAIMRGDMPAFMPSSDQFNIMAELNLSADMAA